ncbi:Cell division protein FtsQ [Chromobacterium violaceum]|uniref:Cell division protein FtsQ n=1 Tax=Chromobacterium violaceum TaxID=536 RepID=A0A3S4IC24_CHRVL|nr:Cell division protein FtsQ [Chromobacterium violaceum]
MFPVKKIRIQGDMNRVTAEQLKFIAEHELSGTFFTLDIDKTRAAFGKLPWVRDAQVRRRWPDALDITVEEHVALARWGENGLVNTRGERFDAASDAKLPVFFGPAGAEKDMTAMLTQMRQSLQPSGLAPRELWLSSRRAWKVVLDNQLQLELDVTTWRRAPSASPPTGRASWRGCRITSNTSTCATRTDSPCGCPITRRRRPRETSD